MGKSEALKAQLAAIRNEAWGEEACGRIGAVSGDQREVLACAIHPERFRRLRKRRPDSLPKVIRGDDVDHWEVFEAGRSVLLGLSDERRRRLFEELAPTHAEALESGWAIMPRATLAYSDFEPGGPFRAPRDTAAVGERRSNWALSCLKEVGPFSCTTAEAVGWVSHLDPYQSGLPWLFAGAVDAGGPRGRAVLDALIACAKGEHPVGGMHWIVVEALLCCGSEEAWAFVEKLLLAAQRQEGLRQSILESVGDAHPGAFRRICRVILEHDLCRFSSVVRAANVWLGLRWDSVSKGVVEDAIASALRSLENPGERARAVDKGTPQEAYFAMWAAAFEDIAGAIPLAEAALRHKNPETRFAGAHVLVNIDQPAVFEPLLRAMDDPDLRVAVRASDQFTTWSRADKPEETFDALERLLGRLKGKKTKIDAALWPWTKRELDAGMIVGAMAARVTSDTAMRLAPYMDRMGPSQRETFACALGDLPDRWNPEWDRADAKPKRIRPEARLTLLQLLNDPSSSVVTAAIRAMQGRPLKADELEILRGLLKRKTAEVRTAVLRRLAALPDDRLLEVAGVLLDSGQAQQRAGGLEILRVMAESKRSLERVRQAAAAWRARQQKLSDAESKALELITEAGIERPRRIDAFGLVNPANLTKPGVARSLPQLKMTDAAWRCLAELAVLVARNKALELPPDEGEEGDGEFMLLGGERIHYSVARPSWRRSLEEDRTRCPIADLVQGWLRSRGPETRDADGLELLRAYRAREVLMERTGQFGFIHRPARPRSVRAWLKAQCKDAANVCCAPLEFVLEWVMRLDGDRGYGDALLDSAEGAVAAKEFATHEYLDDDGEDVVPADGSALSKSVKDWVQCFGALERCGIIASDRARSARLWRLAITARPVAEQCWSETRCDESRDPSTRGASRISIDPEWEGLIDALEAGAATEDDVLDYATHPYWAGEGGQVHWLTQSPDLLECAIGADGRWWLADEHRDLRRALAIPAFASAAQRLRERIIGLELARGEAATEATPMALQIAYAGGAETCIRCVAEMAGEAFRRNVRWRHQSRQAVLTHLVSVTLPGPEDTPERFAALCREAGLSERTLIALGVFAPQWVRHVEHALGEAWTGFEEAVWWIHAHTKDNEYRVDTGLRQKWEAAISERTPITIDEFKDGAVDADWFGRMLGQLGEERWAAVYDAAKFACGGAGHKRAQLFADAMMGRCTEQELTARIKAKRHQDSIRALGLTPLKKGKAGQAQVLARYKLMQEIRRTSRKHGGSMLQASEKRAVEIGMENLARTAGYPDPLRLQWAMERLDLADLAKGPVSAKVKDLTVTLAVSDAGKPEVSAVRNGKALAGVPAAAKKDTKVAELVQRATELRRAGSRMRAALEQAMCRGDTFTGSEVADLFGHPLLWPLLSRLVLVGEGTDLAGYPDRKGKVLRDHAGRLEPLKASDTLRIAHPLDLLKRKDWHRWQRECFAAERVQPFKQVFREVYVPTASEKGKPAEIRRFDGHQVNPRQALAILGSRQWVTRGEEGVQRTFYKERLTARLDFAETFYTPADVEGLTLRALRFTRAGKWETVPLDEVPARVFSEALRDLDLVVSVAHRGGVDPEASQSTMEMRAALVRETAALLNLSNVEIEGSRVRIRGELAEYAVHLGSAGVQVMPGGHVWIVAVGAQHRGRLFLPFADDDPKTAEVVSKVLLLARDREIQDPAILEQLRRFA